MDTQFNPSPFYQRLRRIRSIVQRLTTRERIGMVGPPVSQCPSLALAPHVRCRNSPSDSPLDSPKFCRRALAKDVCGRNRHVSTTARQRDKEIAASGRKFEKVGDFRRPLPGELRPPGGRLMNRGRHEGLCKLGPERLQGEARSQFPCPGFSQDNNRHIDRRSEAEAVPSVPKIFPKGTNHALGGGAEALRGVIHALRAPSSRKIHATVSGIPIKEPPAPKPAAHKGSATLALMCVSRFLQSCSTHRDLLSLSKLAEEVATRMRETLG